MRYYTAFLILLFSGADSHGQELNFPIDSETGKIVYSEVVTVDGVTKNQLHLSAKKWFARSFKSGKSVIQLDDKQEGLIIGKGHMEVSLDGNWGHIHFTMEMFFKEGRYKYIIKDLKHESAESNLGSGGALENEKPACGGMLMFKRQWVQIKENADLNINELIVSLKKSMGEKPNDDW